jgi:hypothetical protein
VAITVTFLVFHLVLAWLSLLPGSRAATVGALQPWQQVQRRSRL